ncbi:mitochondrial fission ELM1 family protein [Xylophilus sp. GOD-11R]|uniref:mitochondrial fission ELM1 family protein n=1 Tax=Xylophilus sp. GOD-11R TaxID=3089814 RepID=UPI00298CF41A|nr:ELM1/GtrOC1 family putative glycosyltransferase [Xylophilus sp. GOD-11R]WPB58969.1 ELM1/GtrOC1 family putative glycosyltransferase [Xylophilus sp. GOD-11R]
MSVAPIDAEVWVLLGSRHGDNQQLLALARALGRPFRSVALQFNAAAGLPPLILGASGLSWKVRDPDALAPPWPRLVLAAGRKSVPAARWIARRSGGRTRLVHLNRPWAPLAWFDLVVTTPQYALPARGNVLINRMPFLPPETPLDAALPAIWQERVGDMPRPWTLVMVGGSSRPYVLDDASALRLAGMVGEQVRRHGGSAWVLGSPRTPASVMDAIESSLDVAATVVRWQRGANNPYPALRHTADRLIVTMDSASMVTEALLSGRPVLPFTLPTRPDWRWKLVAAWRAAALRRPGSWRARLFEKLQDLGWLSSTRDVGLLIERLQADGLFDAEGRAPVMARKERQETVARIEALLLDSSARR